MFANVYPLKRLPRSLGPFTYRVPAVLARQPSDILNRWVSIPFRRREYRGLVWSIQPHPPDGVTGLADISRLLSDPPFTTEQRTILDWLWTNKFLPTATMLWAMVPQQPKTARGKRDLPTPFAERLTVSRSRSAFIAEAVAAARHPTFLRLTDLAERITCILSLLRTNRSAGQTLILVATHDDAVRVWSALVRRIGERAVLLTGLLSPALRWKAWSDAATRQNGCFVTTKVGLLAPYRRLANIVIDRSSDDRHVQSDQNPRYDGRSIAFELARLHASRSLLLDCQPTLAQWADQTIRVAAAPEPAQRRIVVPLGRSGTSGSSLFAEETTKLISAVSGPVAVFHNRRGYATLVRCSECGWQLRCRTCGLVTGTQRRDRARCQRCGQAAGIPDRCPNCKSVGIRERGVGIERLAEELRALFPKRQVATVDRDARSAPGDADIVVGTERLLSASFERRFSTLIVPRLDTHLLYPDFRTVERAYLLFERACSLLAPGGTAVFQTYDPGQPLIVSLMDRTPDRLYADELEVRKRLLLPPSVSVFRLIGSAPTRDGVVAAAQSIHRSLQAAQDIRLSPVMSPTPEQIGTRYRRSILVTVLPERTVPDTLRNVLLSLPDEWYVDPDPLTLNP